MVAEHDNGGMRARLCQIGLIILAGAVLPSLPLGCSTRLVNATSTEFMQGQSSHSSDEQRSGPSTSASTIQKASHQEAADSAVKQNAGQKENGGEKSDVAVAKQKITLQLAIQMGIAQNFRLRAGAEKVRQAQADLITASLIPNVTLFADYQLIPLQATDIHNQLGPPQADVLVSFPIDWLLFGKRVAAMQAAKLGIDVSSADFADLHRVQLGRTVDAFYEVLADEKYLKLAEENLEELHDVEKLTQELAKNKKAGKIELDRIKLANLEALLEKHDRERAFEVAKARLRPLIGLPTDVEFEVHGDLPIPTRVVPPPKLPEAVALADAHRPDLISDQHDINRARAVVEVEQRKAKPQVAVVPGLSYQNQRQIDGFRNGAMFDIGIGTTLPFTDRNQGNILKARAREQELIHIHQADRADALAEVETAVLNYEDAVEHLSFNTPETMKAAYDLRKNVEAAYRTGDRKLDEMLLAHQAYRDRLAHVVEFASDYYRTLNKLNMVVGLNAYDQSTGASQVVGKEGDTK